MDRFDLLKVLLNEADIKLYDYQIKVVRQIMDFENNLKNVRKIVNEKPQMHDKLKVAAQPLVDFINEYYDPHTTIIVENDFVRIVRDDVGVPFEIKD